MVPQVELGIPGLSVPSGTHICCFFRGIQERNEIVVPFLQAGLDSGAKCLGVLDAPSETALAKELGEGGLDIGPAVGELDLRVAKDVYLSGTRFSRHDMLAYWEQRSIDMLGSGAYPSARIVGEMTGAIIKSIGAEEWMRYESEVNRLAPRFPQVMLCLYDLNEFSGELFVDILRTHPMVLLGSTVLKNLYYPDPDEFLAARL